MGNYFTDIPDGSAVALDKSLLQTRFQSLDNAIKGIYNGDASSTGIQQTKLLAPTTLTIASDAVTRTQEWHRLDTESAAANDDLKTISGGVDGMKIVLQIVSASRVVTIRHNTGNIYLMDGMDRVINDTGMTVVLMYSLLLLKWIEIDGTGYLGVKEYLISTPVPTAQIQLPDRVQVGAGARLRRWAVMPSLEVSNMWAVRAAAATVQPIGIAAPSNAATTVLSNGNQADSTYANVASGGSNGNIGGFASATFDLVRRQHNPIYEFIIETTSASADLGNVRCWHGLFQAAPTNVDTLAGSTAAFFFNFSTVLGHTNWMAGCDDGTNQSTLVSTGVAVAVSTRYKMRIRVDSANGLAYFSVNDNAEVAVSTNLPSASQNLGFAHYHITQAALAKNWLFSRSQCLFT